MSHNELVERCQDGMAVIARRYIPDRAELAAAETMQMLPTALIINWEALATDLVLKLLRNVGDLLIEKGREHRDDIERAAEEAIIGIVVWNIPGLPDSIERKLDASFQESATQAVQALLNSVFGPKN